MIARTVSVGSRQNFFSLTVCSWGQYLRNGSEKVVFGPIGSNAKVEPALPIAICHENGDTMLELTEISRPA